jgi:hypothetical protein
MGFVLLLGTFSFLGGSFQYFAPNGREHPLTRGFARNGREHAVKSAEQVHVLFLATERPKYMYGAMKVAARLQARPTSMLVVHLLTDRHATPNVTALAAPPPNVTHVLHFMDDMSNATQHRLRFFQNHTKGVGRLYMCKPMLHQILPLSVTRVIVLDSDVVLLKDVGQLWRLFDDFHGQQLVGMAYEQQPVPLYGEYGTLGVNGGVQLLDLEGMRRSELYEKTILASLDVRNVMRGAFGDQDLYTAMYTARPELFFVLPCQWNVQLCGYFLNNWKQLAKWVESTARMPSFPHQPVCKKDFALIHGNCGQSKNLMWRVYENDLHIASYMPEVRKLREPFDNFSMDRFKFLDLVKSKANCSDEIPVKAKHGN